MPGYNEYMQAQKVARDVASPAFRARWSDNDTLSYSLNGESMTWKMGSDLTARGGVLTSEAGTGEPAFGPNPQQQPGRGRQFTTVNSPDNKLKAVYDNGNVYIEADGQRKAVTTDGDPAKRIIYGTASWVYGEELEQRYAMGFSPDSKKLWYYRFDDGEVIDYYLTINQRQQQVSLYTEAYPKPGKPNPKVDLYLYDVASGKSMKVKVRPGDYDNGIGHYVYAINFGEDSKELFFHRMNRQQKVRDLCAVDVNTGAVRIVDHIENQAGWVEFGPIEDVRTGRSRDANPAPMPGKLLINDEDDGYFNLYWLDTKAGKRTKVTSNKADVARVLSVDDAKSKIYYLCHDGSTPYRMQLHVVGFDGSGDKRLTDPNFNHTVALNPENTAFSDEAQTSESLPKLTVRDMTGKTIKEIGQAKMPAMQGFVPQKWLTAESFDGTTTLYCELDFPRNFDPNKKYPVLVDVYGGPLPPSGGGPAETWQVSSTFASTGFLILKVHGRDEDGRGRTFRQAIYRKMGIVEIDDQAAGVKALAQLPYVDTNRVGIYGTSYGGYASGMALLRYPDLFAAASCSSMVTQWTNYDTTYTERYMDLYENNKEGYAAGSCMTYADQLKGWLMIYYGTADDNVHPANCYQLFDALNRAGKFYEVQVGVDRGHTGLNIGRMMEFFTERLVMDGPRK